MNTSIICAFEDEAFRDELSEHLRGLERAGVICVQRRALPGDPWFATQHAQINDSDLVLCLVSSYFMCSDECQQLTMKALTCIPKTRVVPILLRPYDITHTIVEGLQSLPRNLKAVTAWPDRHEAWREIAVAIRQLAPPTVGAIPTPKPTPRFPSEQTKQLSLKLEEARLRRDALQRAGFKTTEVEREILDLRRQLREGGRLHAGDWLGDGRYWLLEPLGKGGFGIVWRALDRATERQVAIKVLHSQLASDQTRIERFFRGSRVMLALRGEGIVSVLEPKGIDEGYYYYVMEYINGGDFREGVKTKLFSYQDVIRIILKVGEALSRAHQSGFYHRDVKPSNIMIDTDGNPLLTDFDLVAGYDTTGGTRTGALGDFIYAAPEMMQYPDRADARADVYGLGMTAIFGLHGADLGIAAVKQPRQIVNALPCSRGVKSVLLHAVESDAKKRFGGIAEMCSALQAANIVGGSLRNHRLRVPAIATTLAGSLILAGTFATKWYFDSSSSQPSVVANETANSSFIEKKQEHSELPNPMVSGSVRVPGPESADPIIDAKTASVRPSVLPGIPPGRPLNPKVSATSHHATADLDASSSSTGALVANGNTVSSTAALENPSTPETTISRPAPSTEASSKTATPEKTLDNDQSGKDTPWWN